MLSALPRPLQSESLSNNSTPTTSAMSSPTSSRTADTQTPFIRPDRPCDACRRRKSRCVINPDSSTCVMCEFHKQACTFVEDAVPRRRKAPNQNASTNVTRIIRS